MHRHVRFAYLNLVKDVYPSGWTGTLGLDLILFRNVAIYLKPEVTRAIIERFQRALRPGGWLLLGEVELSLTPRALSPDNSTRQPSSASQVMRANGCRNCLRRSPRFCRPGNLTAPTVPTWGPLPWTAATTPSAVRPEARCGSKSNGMRHKEFFEAERALDKMTPVKERAKNRVRYVGLLLGMAELGRARQMIDVCLREEPLLIEAQFWKAGFAEEAGDLDSAEKAYRRALYIDRQCPWLISTWPSSSSSGATSPAPGAA